MPPQEPPVPSNAFAGDTVSVNLQLNPEVVAQDFGVYRTLLENTRHSAEAMVEASARMAENVESIRQEFAQGFDQQTQVLQEAERLFNNIGDRMTSRVQEAGEAVVEVGRTVNTIMRDFVVEVASIATSEDVGRLVRSVPLYQTAGQLSTQEAGLAYGAVAQRLRNANVPGLPAGLQADSLQRLSDLLMQDTEANREVAQTGRESVEVEKEIRDLQKQVVTASEQVARNTEGGPGSTGGAAGWTQQGFQELGMETLEQNLARLRYVPGMAPAATTARRLVGNVITGGAARTALGLAGAGLAAYQGVDRALALGGEYTQLTGGTSVAQAGQYEAQARLMALSPFISSAQAQEIVRGTLAQGYGGREANTVMEFVAQNVREGTADVAESLEIYRTAVHDAGASTEEVSTALATMQRVARNTGASVEELTTSYRTQLEAFTTAGATGGGASAAAATTANIWAGIPGLPEQFAPDVTNLAFQMRMGAALGVPAPAVPGTLGALAEQRTEQFAALTIADAASFFENRGITREMLEAEPGTPEYNTLVTLLYPLTFQMGAFGWPVPPGDVGAAIALGRATLGGGAVRQFRAQTRAQRELYGPQELNWGERRQYEMRGAALPPGITGAQRAEQGLRSAYFSMAAEQGQALPLFEEFLNRDVNWREMAVVTGGEDVVQLGHWLRNNPAAWEQLRSGQVRLANLGGRDVERILRARPGEQAMAALGDARVQTLAEMYDIGPGALPEGQVQAGSQQIQIEIIPRGNLDRYLDAVVRDPNAPARNKAARATGTSANPIIEPYVTTAP